MAQRINVSIVICLALLHEQLLLSTDLLPVLRFGKTAPTGARNFIGRSVAIATPGVALFFEGHSHGNMEHYATLANIHSD